MRYLLAIFVAALALVFLPLTLTAMDKEANTIDELMEMFDESSCMDCHEEILTQWADSWHAQAVVSSLGSIHNFIEIGLKKEWETPLTKAQILKCLDFDVQINPYSHLPGQIKDAKDPKKWVPSAIVNVFIENKTGHRVPDG